MRAFIIGATVLGVSIAVGAVIYLISIDDVVGAVQTGALGIFMIYMGYCEDCRARGVNPHPDRHDHIH